MTEVYGCSGDLIEFDGDDKPDDEQGLMLESNGIVSEIRYVRTRPGVVQAVRVVHWDGRVV